MINAASEIYNKLLNIGKTQYDNLSKVHQEKLNVLNKPKNLTPDLYLDEDEDENELPY